MPIPTLTEKDREKITDLQADLIERVFDQWKYHEKPLTYQIASGSYNKRAKKAGITIRILIDSVVTLQYIDKYQTRRGGYILVPHGVWEKLPPYKKDTWLNPTKRKVAKCEELDFGRKVRLIESERDEPLYDSLGAPIVLKKPVEADKLPDPNQTIPDKITPEDIRRLMADIPEEPSVSLDEVLKKETDCDAADPNR